MINNKYNLQGLSNEEVKKRKSLGLSNQKIDSYSPSLFTIFRRNYVNINNAILVPLVTILAVFGLWREVLVFFSFIIFNSAFGAWDELRVKKRLDELQKEFQREATVIRNGRTDTISASEVVKGDLVVAQEGEGIIADGKVVFENFLQIDQAMLTGESDYIRKVNGDSVLSGSFVVTGECVYEVEKVGKQNYLNRLGSEATSFSQTKSNIQKIGNFIAGFLALLGFGAAILNFVATSNAGFEQQERLLAVTSILALIIPQSLIFLFTLVFSVSVTKLSNKGILIQKKGSIDELATIDVLCMDKTGTITTNFMQLKEKKYWNFKEDEIGSFYKSVMHSIVGRNKTQEVLDRNFSDYEETSVKDFQQTPFTSKNKFSLIQAAFGQRYKRIVFGAPSVLLKEVKPEVRAKIEKYVSTAELNGFRVILALYTIHNEEPDLEKFSPTDKVAAFVITETLNPGIKKVLADLAKQDISLKVISGDSLKSVASIAQKVGIPAENVIDLSDTLFSVEELALEKQVFARAKPEDKLAIIKALQQNGHRVAMIGDGVNDVLSMKMADVGISMESGSKITRDIADIVLLENDYKKIPQIFFEGNNIIFNLRLASKMYVAKSITTVVFVLFLSLIPKVPLPLYPTSTLIFSFFASTIPSYVVSLTRENVKSHKPFLQDVFQIATPISVMFGLMLCYVYLIANSGGLENSDLRLNTTITMAFLSFNLLFVAFLFRESGKLKSIGGLFLMWLVGFGNGIFFTFLPVIQYKSTNNLILSASSVLAALLLVFFLMRFVLSKMNPKLKNTSWLILIGGFLLASFFPVKEYYAINPIPAYYYGQIIVLTFIALVALILVYPLHRSLFKKVKLAKA